MPSYVKREFEVYNSRVEEEVTLTHFAYSGWGDAPQRPRSPNPGLGSPEMPANTTGLLDLVEHALAHKVEASLPGPSIAGTALLALCTTSRPSKSLVIALDISCILCKILIL